MSLAINFCSSLDQDAVVKENAGLLSVIRKANCLRDSLGMGLFKEMFVNGCQQHHGIICFFITKLNL